MILAEMRANGETWDDLISITLSDDDLDQGFEAVSPRGKPFTAWTKARVYFPVKYDDTEWVDSVPRNPNGQATEHVGG